MRNTLRLCFCLIWNPLTRTLLRLCNGATAIFAYLVFITYTDFSEIYDLDYGNTVNGENDIQVEHSEIEKYEYKNCAK